MADSFTRGHPFHHVAVARGWCRPPPPAPCRRRAGRRRPPAPRGRRAALPLRQLGVDVTLGPAQAVGLGLAPAFGHGLGEIGEQQGEPEPEGDGQDERRGRLALAQQGLEVEQGGQGAADPDREHHRVLELVDRVELGEGGPDAPASRWRARTGAWAGVRRRKWRCAWAGSPQNERKLFGDGAQGQGRDEGQGADDQHHRHQQGHEQGAVGGQGPGSGRGALLARPGSRRWPAPGGWCRTGPGAWRWPWRCCRRGCWR